MSKYPTLGEIDLRKYDDIPDSTIAKDIADTEAEIEGLLKVQAAERIIADSHPNENERHLADFKATGRIGQIREREDFVAFLQLIQEGRKERATVTA